VTTIAHVGCAVVTLLCKAYQTPYLPYIKKGPQIIWACIAFIAPVLCSNIFTLLETPRLKLRCQSSIVLDHVVVRSLVVKSGMRYFRMLVMLL